MEHPGSEDLALDESAPASGRGEWWNEKNTSGLAKGPGSGSRAGKLGRKAFELGKADVIL